jgi:hypothetical protein
MRARIKLLMGWDLLGALGVALLVVFLFRGPISAAFAKEVYEMGGSVLAIVFSVFVAALAIITSSSDDEFIRFLEEENLFTELLWGFKITLWLLFVALVYAVVLFLWTASYQPSASASQPPLLLGSFLFLFTWALLATISTTNASVNYAQLRVRFLKARKP